MNLEEFKKALENVINVVPVTIEKVLVCEEGIKFLKNNLKSMKYSELKTLYSMGIPVQCVCIDDDFNHNQAKILYSNGDEKIIDLIEQEIL